MFPVPPGKTGSLIGVMGPSKMPINHHLSPCWVQLTITVCSWFLVPGLVRGKVTTRNKVWSEEAILTLQGCLDSTAWEEFIESSGEGTH